MDSATPYHRCASVVVHVWISQLTCLDLSPVRDSFTRDHHALPSGRSPPARRIRGRDRGSASELLPPRALVLRFVSDRAFGQSSENCADRRLLAEAVRSRLPPI